MFRDKRVVLLVVFLLAFSFVNLTFFASFIKGLSNTFQNEIIDTETGHIKIEPTENSGSLYLSGEEEIRKKIEAIPGVVGVASHLRVPGTATFEDEQISLPIIAIDPQEEQRVTTIHEQLISGLYLSKDDRAEIILGKELAEDPLQQGESPVGRQGLRVSAGEFINVTFFNGVTREFHVKGIAGKDGPGAVQRLAYITYVEGLDIIGDTDIASEILVRLPSKDLADIYRIRLLEAGVPGEVKTWYEASNFARVIETTFAVVIYITSFVGLLIAMITVGIVTFINTNRKKRHIATLKALGAQNSLILGIFLMESLIFGVLGTALGMGIIHFIVKYLQENPVRVPIGLIRPELTSEIMISASVLLILASIIAGLIPAYIAVRQPMLKNLRVE